MPGQAAKLHVQLDLDPEADAEELDELTARLRRELLELDVEAVDRARTEEPPPGARAVDVAELGTLIITAANTAAALGGIVNTIRSWLSRGQSRSAKLKFNGDTLDVTGISSEQQERLIAAWISRHAEG